METGMEISGWQELKYLLTMDDDPSSDNEGIRRINVLDWLTGDSLSPLSPT
ncbi:hypothetical protein AGMMS50293_26150 [Spirochaetia bacterium]|nr:hypothetical protein AGMMS50293_26150 [Spirochaetia bacterium]